MVTAERIRFLRIHHNWTQKKLSEKDIRLVKAWRKQLALNQTLKCNDTEFDPERLKGLFELYYEKKAEKDWVRQQRHARIDS